MRELALRPRDPKLLRRFSVPFLRISLFLLIMGVSLMGSAIFADRTGASGESNIEAAARAVVFPFLPPWLFDAPFVAVCPAPCSSSTTCRVPARDPFLETFALGSPGNGSAEGFLRVDRPVVVTPLSTTD